MKRILVPVDGSEGANRAVRFAAGLALELGCTVTLLHVYDAPTAALLGFEAVAADRFEKAKNQVAEGSFEAARAAAGTGVSFDTHATIGHPANEIVAYAKANPIDLIVIGSRGLSELQGLLLGSVSHYVAHHAPCPVTIVR